jgi:hypothetical protein
MHLANQAWQIARDYGVVANIGGNDVSGELNKLIIFEFLLYHLRAPRTALT